MEKRFSIDVENLSSESAFVMYPKCSQMFKYSHDALLVVS